MRVKKAELWALVNNNDDLVENPIDVVRVIFENGSSVYIRTDNSSTVDPNNPPAGYDLSYQHNVNLITEDKKLVVPQVPVLLPCNNSEEKQEIDGEEWARRGNAYLIARDCSGSNCFEGLFELYVNCGDRNLFLLRRNSTTFRAHFIRILSIVENVNLQLPKRIDLKENSNLHLAIYSAVLNETSVISSPVNLTLNEHSLITLATSRAKLTEYTVILFQRLQLTENTIVHTSSYNFAELNETTAVHVYQTKWVELTENDSIHVYQPQWTELTENDSLHVYRPQWVELHEKDHLYVLQPEWVELTEKDVFNRVAHLSETTIINCPALLKLYEVSKVLLPLKISLHEIDVVFTAKRLKLNENTTVLQCFRAQWMLI